jgi:hypothetical protein
MEMNFYHSIFWFLIGVVSYRIGSRLFGLVLSVSLFTDTVLAILGMVRYMDKNMNNVLEAKYNIMHDDEELKKSIEQRKIVDRALLDGWRQITIDGIKKACPRSIKSIYRFNTWDEAMVFLEKHLSKGQ